MPGNDEDDLEDLLDADLDTEEVVRLHTKPVPGLRAAPPARSDLWDRVAGRLATAAGQLGPPSGVLHRREERRLAADSDAELAFGDPGQGMVARCVATPEGLRVRLVLAQRWRGRLRVEVRLLDGRRATVDMELPRHLRDGVLVSMPERWQVDDLDCIRLLAGEP